MLSIWNELKRYTLDEQLKAFLSSKHSLVYIFKLKNTKDNKKFINRGFAEWDKNDMTPNINLYELVYVSKLHNIEIENVDSMLENILETFKVNRPDDYEANPITTSDVIGVHTQDMNIFRFMDSLGFVQIESDEFLLEINDLESSIEDGYDLIDDILNKLKNPISATKSDTHAKRKRKSLDYVFEEIKRKYR